MNHEQEIAEARAWVAAEKEKEWLRDEVMAVRLKELEDLFWSNMDRRKADAELNGEPRTAYEFYRGRQPGPATPDQILPDPTIKE